MAKPISHFSPDLHDLIFRSRVEFQGKKPTTRSVLARPCNAICLTYSLAKFVRLPNTFSGRNEMAFEDKSLWKHIMQLMKLMKYLFCKRIALC